MYFYYYHFKEKQSRSQRSYCFVEPHFKILVRGDDLKGIKYRDKDGHHANGRQYFGQHDYPKLCSVSVHLGRHSNQSYSRNVTKIGRKKSIKISVSVDLLVKRIV